MLNCTFCINLSTSNIHGAFFWEEICYCYDKPLRTMNNYKKLKKEKAIKF